MRTVVLASGGIDSTLLMKLLADEGYFLEPLFIDYSQRAAEAEWKALQNVCTELELPAPTRFPMKGCGIFGSALTTESKDLKEEAFLPGRNLLFLVAGAGFAYSIDSSSVAIGLVENPLFPDQTSQFVKKAGNAVEEALGEKIQLLTPLLDMDKREILHLALSEGLPFSKTYSCHSGTPIPCQTCIACEELQEAIEALEKEGVKGVEKIPMHRSGGSQ